VTWNLILGALVTYQLLQELVPLHAVVTPVTVLVVVVIVVEVVVAIIVVGVNPSLGSTPTTTPSGDPTYGKGVAVEVLL